MGKRLQIAVWVVFIALVCFIAYQAIRPISQPPVGNIMFRGKSLGTWFYGSRTDFFSQRLRDAAQEALNGVGTNAFPFLLSVLKAPRGTPMAYNKAYRVMPGWMKPRLPYPLSNDDIRAIAFGHLRNMQARLSCEQFGALVELVPKLQNPRLRMQCLTLLSGAYQTHSELLRLCRKLLDDTEPAVRLEAAIPLAESAIMADPKEPKLAVILLPAFEHKEMRDDWDEINSYWFQREPAGSSGRAPSWGLGITAPYLSAGNQVLQERIKTSLIRLEPYLTPEQRSTFRGLEESVPKRFDHSFF